MTITRRTIGTILLSGSIGVAALAQGSPLLNVKLGLWEITIDMGGAGMPPGIDLSKLTPEQQAMAMQAMKARGMSMSPGGMTMQNCITREKLSNGQFKQDRPGQTCKQKVTKSSATIVDVTETCTSTDQPPVTTTSELHIEALSQTSVKMTGKSTGGKNETVNLTGKWLAADCGTIK